MCLLIILNDLRIPQVEDAKYLKLYLDCRLNWKKYIFTKQKQFGLQLGKMNWLLGHNCRLKTSCYYIKQFSNLLESMASNFGAQLLIQI